MGSKKLNTIDILQAKYPNIFKQKYSNTKDKDLYFSEHLHLWAIHKKEDIPQLAPLLFGVEDLIPAEILLWAIRGDMIPFSYNHLFKPDEWTDEQRSKMMRLSELVLRMHMSVEKAFDEKEGNVITNYLSMVEKLGSCVVYKRSSYDENMIRCCIQNNDFIQQLCKDIHGDLDKEIVLVAFYISSTYYNNTAETYAAIKSESAKNKEAISLKEEGTRMVKNREFMRAVTMYSKAIKLTPLNYVLYGNRAQAYIELGRNRDAEWDAARSVVLKADWTKGIYLFAIALIRQGRDNIAKDMLRHFLIQQFPASEDANVNLLNGLLNNANPIDIVSNHLSDSPRLEDKRFEEKGADGEPNVLNDNGKY